MASWIGQAARRGILTTSYPNRPAEEDEVPPLGRPPLPTGLTEAAPTDSSLCPVGAIRGTSVDQGLCIRCARCLPAGFRFVGPVEAATRTRAELVQSGPPVPPMADEAARPTGFRRSIHVFMVDVGSCNACNLEVFALANPFYDSQRLGIFFTNSPRHADVLVVVGVPTPEMVEPLRRAYEAIPAPRFVVAVGACPISGGVFAGGAGLSGPLDRILPVDVYVPGCPPPPVAILDGILRIAGRERPGGPR